MKGGRKGMESLGRVNHLLIAMVAGQLAKELEEEELKKGSNRNSEKDYNLTTKDVARMFGVHPKTVDRWRRRLGLPSKKFGRSVRYCKGEVLRWAAQRKEG